MTYRFYRRVVQTKTLGNRTKFYRRVVCFSHQQCQNADL